MVSSTQNETKEVKADSNVDPDMDLFGLNSLYTDTDYKEITFSYKHYTQTVQALKGASTDYDLTGQVIWQAANIFSRYLLDESPSADG